MPRALLASLLVLGCATTTPTTAPAPAEDEGFRPIFDGATLAGWTAPDMSYFSVEDGAITGTTTREHNPKRNQFIVWQDGKVDDFQLRFKFRMFGPEANSGMQFRGEVREHGLIYGYQADIGMKDQITGGIWDEYGPRNSLAGQGEKAAIAEDGKKAVERLAAPGEVGRGIDLSKWNDYEITARGSHIVLKINGRVTAELDDRETGKAAASGVLGMPIIPGEPMKVQYKDIRLKVLR